MFTPITNTSFLPTSPTLVATPLPNSIALRVPYDTVSPSVSSAQLDNNASGNRNPLPKIDITQFQTSANAQTAFLTQLASSDISLETHGLFVQYEKLVSYANVKYKPSNAGKPVEPVGIFKNLLQQETPASTVELPTNPEPVQKIDIPAPAPQSQPSNSQIQAYNATTARNDDIPATGLVTVA